MYGVWKKSISSKKFHRRFSFYVTIFYVQSFPVQPLRRPVYKLRRVLQSTGTPTVSSSIVKAKFLFRHMINTIFFKYAQGISEYVGELLLTSLGRNIWFVSVIERKNENLDSRLKADDTEMTRGGFFSTSRLRGLETGASQKDSSIVVFCGGFTVDVMKSFYCVLSDVFILFRLNEESGRSKSSDFLYVLSVRVVLESEKSRKCRSKKETSAWEWDSSITIH